MANCHRDTDWERIKATKDSHAGTLVGSYKGNVEQRCEFSRFPKPYFCYVAHVRFFTVAGVSEAYLNTREYVDAVWSGVGLVGIGAEHHEECRRSMGWGDMRVLTEAVYENKQYWEERSEERRDAKWKKLFHDRCLHQVFNFTLARLEAMPLDVEPKEEEEHKVFRGASEDGNFQVLLLEGRAKAVDGWTLYADCWKGKKRKRWYAAAEVSFERYEDAEAEAERLLREYAGSP